jgi:hypothetical protein
MVVGVEHRHTTASRTAARTSTAHYSKGCALSSRSSLSLAKQCNCIVVVVVAVAESIVGGIVGRHNDRARSRAACALRQSRQHAATLCRRQPIDWHVARPHAHRSRVRLCSSTMHRFLFLSLLANFARAPLSEPIRMSPTMRVKTQCLRRYTTRRRRYCNIC